MSPTQMNDCISDTRPNRISHWTAMDISKPLVPTTITTWFKKGQSIIGDRNCQKQSVSRANNLTKASLPTSSRTCKRSYQGTQGKKKSTRFNSFLRSSFRYASVGFMTLPPFVVFIFSSHSLPLAISLSHCQPLNRLYEETRRYRFRLRLRLSTHRKLYSLSRYLWGELRRSFPSATVYSRTLGWQSILPV